MCNPQAPRVQQPRPDEAAIRRRELLERERLLFLLREQRREQIIRRVQNWWICQTVDYINQPSPEIKLAFSVSNLSPVFNLINSSCKFIFLVVMSVHSFPWQSCRENGTKCCSLLNSHPAERGAHTKHEGEEARRGGVLQYFKLRSKVKDVKLIFILELNINIKSSWCCLFLY